jgi:broad specificity phosphatase PhoE
MENSSLYCTFYLVRHGKTDYNEKKKINGSVDVALNDIGKQQAEDLRKEFMSIHFDAIFSSDLLRAKQTAEILGKERELAIAASVLIRERNFGQLEGHPVDELKTLVESYRKLADEEINAHKVDDTYESNDEMIARVLTFLRETAIAYPGKTILVVTHSSLLRTLLIHLGYVSHKDAPFRLIRNAGYVKLKSDGVEFKILEVNPGGVIE